MALGQTKHSGRFEQAVILGQLALALAVMALIVFAPRSGEPVALYPTGLGDPKAVPALISAPQTLVLARGSLDGSYIIRGNRPGFFESLFGYGVLLLNASAPGCGPLPAEPSQ